VCLFSKLLEDGDFRWPKIEDGVMRLSAAQLSALIEGLDWRRVRAAKETPAPSLVIPKALISDSRGFRIWQCDDSMARGGFALCPHL
jgi:transposase